MELMRVKHGADRNGMLLKLLRSAGCIGEDGRVQPNLSAALERALGFKLEKNQQTALRQGIDRDTKFFVKVGQLFFDREAFEAAKEKPQEATASEAVPTAERATATLPPSAPSALEQAYDAVTDEARRTLERGAALAKQALRGLPPTAALQALDHARAAIERLVD